MQVLAVPGVPPAGRRKSAAQQVPRTRTGCWSCRDRSVKCDETRPRCLKCARLNLSCHYGVRLQWVEDSEARGICHGRQGVWSSNGTARRGKPHSKSASISSQPASSPLALRPASTAVASPTFFLNTFDGDIQHYLVVSGSGRSAPAYITLPGMDSFLDKKAADDSEDESGYPCVARPRTENRKLPASDSPPHRSRGQHLRFDLSTPVALNPAGLANYLTESDEYILQFYVQVVCSTTTILDDEFHNPQRYALIPMTSSSERVLAAVLAIGATKLAYNDARFRRRALYHRHQVIANLAGLLEDIHTDHTRYLEALASTMILCWCDITDLCRSSWTDHLKGLSGILEACPSQASRDPHATWLIQTCQQYLIYHLVMAKATFQINDVIPNSMEILLRYIGQDHLSSKSWPSNDDPLDASSGSPSQLANPGHGHPAILSNMDHIEPHQGFSNTLLVLINRICDLADASSEDSEDSVSLDERVRRLEIQLQTLTQLAPMARPRGQQSSSGFTDPQYHAERSQLSQHKLESITATAEAHRLAALVFLAETCALHLPHIVPDCRASRSAHTEEILRLVESVCSREPVTAALPIWPIFIVGCATVIDEDRLRVLNILDQFQCRRIFGSIPPACAVIEAVWRQRDLGSDENPRKTPPTLSMVGSGVDILASRGGGRRKRRGRPENPGKPGVAVASRYPWEQAMFMLGGSILSLT